MPDVADSIEPAPPLPIDPRERAFADEYFAGQNPGNATRSYQAVYPNASYDTASVEASILLKLPRVREYLADLHRTATMESAERLAPWADLLPLAQAVIVATAQGRLRNRLAYEAAVYLTNRVMGAPVASHAIQVTDHTRIGRAIAAFARRTSPDLQQAKSEGS